MNWPRLSLDLPHHRDYATCQACGAPAKTTWQECDDEDQPEPIYVRLCIPCADRRIDPHPRLYRPIDKDAPAPGAMAACTDCQHAEALACQSPLLKANGGPGLPIHSNQIGFACARGKGGCRRLYDGPPRCDGHTPRPNPLYDVYPPETGGGFA
jgi:hypothetical protein